MTWLFLSLLSAFTVATTDTLTKHFFSRLTSLEMGLIRLLYSLPWLLLSLFWIPWPELDRTFWLAVALALPLEITASITYMKALKSSPLSLSLPFLAFTPLFVLLTGWVLLGEKISQTGFYGIVLIIAGSYSLNFSQIGSGFWAPFKSIFKEPGSRLMLLAASIYAFTSTLGKLAINHSHPLFFPALYYLLLSSVMMLLFPLTKTSKPSRLIQRPMAALLVGLIGAVSLYCHMLAISQIQVAYMISVKRTSLFFGVLYGALWFKEDKVWERLFGVALMISGVFLIGWKG